ncbi:T9SS type B sorting domain-containing protein [Aureibaculum marinum]|uniref:T9SS type B sorting domain-containing protein n=1 Tax=Aureibaculum marinum TaxID=2487930 RepID=UPI000F503320|nr:T9SS type B sorting domain-containing protein [Aureibaculum marinum]
MKKLIPNFYILFFLVPFFSWTQTTISTVGNSVYCPLSEVNIVTDFNIIDTENTTIKALYIQISEGYSNGEDLLKLNNPSNHPNISATWSAIEGKLTLKSTTNSEVSYTDLIAAVKDVVFTNNSATVSGYKSFSFTIGSANYLPSTGHYYEYVSDVGITWKEAKVAAESRTYYGLQGYLVTITSTEEAKLAGEQAKGTGWIGGSDAEKEGNWKWETGPEKGTYFWYGSASGSSPTYAFWNTGEPNNLDDEDYAHITAPGVGISGSWNDLSNTGAANGDFQPKGYIVEYGGMPEDPIVNISASTTMYIPGITSTTKATRCGQGEITLTATSNVGNVVWHDSPTGGSILFTGNQFNTSITTTTTYYASVIVVGCKESPRIPVEATLKELPDIDPVFNFKNCDVDGVADGYTVFNLNEATPFITKGNDELNTTYHLSIADAENNNTSISNPNSFNSKTATTVYARVENLNGCFLISTVNLNVSTTSFPEKFTYNLATCDNLEANDGIASFDLTKASDQLLNQFPSNQNLKVYYYKTLNDAQLKKNDITNQTDYINKTPYTESLYIRVENTDDGACYGIGPSLLLTVNPRPEFEVVSETALCLNIGSVTLETFNALDDYSYEWKNENNEIISTEPTATVNSKGIYTVIATSNLNCTSSSKTITVKYSDLANITLNNIQIHDDSENNTITINSESIGIGDYEFSLDDEYGIYQTDPLFENVSAGIHTLYIREQNNCGIVAIEISVIGFPKFFTPNNDGYNDTWQIKGINKNSFQLSTIYIYDRFGKLLTKLDTTDGGWDGTYNGKPMPSNDYWFKVQLIDKNGTVRNKKGHFSLIRR